MQRLLRSSKFWTAVLDVAISFVTYFVTKYVAPDLAKDVLFVIGGMQPIWLMVIGATAYEDGKAKAATTEQLIYNVAGPKQPDDSPVTD